MTLTHALFDLNGTLAVDGSVVDGVPSRIREIEKVLHCTLVSSDTNGTLAAVATALGLRFRRVQTGAEKVAIVDECRGAGASGVVLIGNGRNDASAMKQADLAIAVIFGEGADPRACMAADIVCTSPLAALDLLRYPGRISATLRP